MGKKNRNAQPHQQTHVLEKRERQCDWCRIPHMEGSVWDGQWVCIECFPPNALTKKKEEEKKRKAELVIVRKCDSCHKKTNDGGILLGKWVCSGCCSFLGQGKKHKNKYAEHSHVDKHHPGHLDVVTKPKPHRKGRHPKLKKIVYWVVVITDISDGKL